MDKAALKEFRAKLVLAKGIARERNYDHWINKPCGPAALYGDNTVLDWNGITPQPRDFWDWYWYASPSERCAMWDNSIAAIDQQISELHQ